VGKAAQKASPIVLKTWPPWASMALRKISSWRERTVRIVSGLFSHILLEPSMSVNRKVTVPLGGAAICLRVLLLLKRHYNTGNAPSEVEGVEVARDLHRAVENSLNLGRELCGIHEAAGVKVREDQPPDPGVARDPARIRSAGVTEGVRLLGAIS
jgi:hypothetical protein